MHRLTVGVPLVLVVVGAVSGVVACRHDNGGTPTIPANVLDGKPTIEPPAKVYSGDEGQEGTTTVKPHSVPGSPDTLTAEAACERFAALVGSRCDWTERFPAAFHEGDTCVVSLNNWFDPATEGHDKFQRMTACWSQDCDAAAACMTNVQQHAPPPKPRSCGEDGTAPILVDAKEYAARKGATTRRFSDVETSAASPVEVCGVQGEVEWMVRVTCNDGSNPYHSLETANSSRDSYLQNGGRCNSVLDRYTVKCPEATYPIYVDRYVCPKS